MGLEIQTKAVQLKDGTQKFSFSGDVGAYVYGLSGFDVSYSDGSDHHLEIFEIVLQANQPSKNEIHVTPTIKFSDASGKSAGSNSYITISVVAWIGDDADRNVSMNNAIDLGSASFNTGSTAYFGQAVQAGWDLSYGSKDHHVLSMSASTGLQLSGTTATLSGTAAMADNDGNMATTATVNAGYLASLQSDPGFGVQITKIDGYGTGQTATFDFGQDVDQVAVFLLGYDLSYGSGKDHHIQEVALGQWGSSKIGVSGSTATVNVSVIFQDTSNPPHTATTHTLDLVAIGRYK